MKYVIRKQGNDKRRGKMLSQQITKELKEWVGGGGGEYYLGMTIERGSGISGRAQHTSPSPLVEDLD